MIRDPSREIALNHLDSSWAHVYKCIQNGCANDDNFEYEYHKFLFDKSLSYIESLDRKYHDDGIIKTQMKDEYD